MAEKSITVIYKFIDGAHFFVSTDKEAQGLCAASPDLLVAYNEVALQLNAIHKANTGEEVQYSPVTPLSVFQSWLEKTYSLVASAPKPLMPIPSAEMPWHTLHEQRV
jgi:hypothetical protein